MIGKFKKFLLTEEISTSRLGTKIDDMANSPMFAKKLSKSVSSNGDEMMQKMDSIRVPTELKIHSIEKTGKISTLHVKKNPIYMRLDNGTEAHFSYEEYRRIKGKPALGKTISLFFQRHPNDSGSDLSKIDKAIVRD